MTTVLRLKVRVCRVIIQKGISISYIEDCKYLNILERLKCLYYSMYGIFYLYKLSLAPFYHKKRQKGLKNRKERM